MIDNFYIESAISIRKEFLRLNELLESDRSSLLELTNVLQKAVSELEEYNKKITEEKSIESIKEFIIVKLNYLEEEINRIGDKIDPINKKIEKLRIEEMDLYLSIKERYPDLSDFDIKNYITEKLK